jgi:uncharacterized repeat protein (TIGR01451 family)
MLLRRLILLPIIAASVIAPYRAHEAHAAQILFSEPFSGRVTTNWIGGGTAAACLTAGYESGGILGCLPGVSGGVTGSLPDPNNDGALRLTSAEFKQAGYVIYNATIPTANGLDITFDYYSYGGSGGDGLSFILIDGNANPTKPGGSGGSLGYAPLVYPSTGINQPGIAGGYLAVGFDEFGNFINSLEGRNAGCPTSPHASILSPNTVSVRGAAGVGGTISQLPAFQGYCLLQSSGMLSKSLSAPDVKRSSAIVRHVRIVLDVSGTLSIYIDFGAGYQLAMPALKLADIATQPSAPATVKLAFAGSTGGNTNIHEVRNLVVRADRIGTRITKTHSGDFANGRRGTYRLELANSGTLATSPGASARITDTLPAGLTYVDGSCAGAGWICLGAGSLVTATYVPTDVIAANTTLSPVSFDVNVDSPQPVVTNTAVATLQFPGGSDTDNVSDITFIRAPSLDVHMAMIPSAAIIGRLVTFSVSLKNTGSDSTPVVQMTFVPTGPLIVQSATATGGGAVWTCTTAPITRCTAPSFDLGGNAEMIVVARIVDTAPEGQVVAGQLTAETTVREIGTGANVASAQGVTRERWPAFAPIITRDTR